MLKTVLILALGLAMAFSAVAQARPQRKKEKVPPDFTKLPAASPRKDVTYVADIKPILDESCAKCHGAERPKARLRLDSLEGALKGSEHGKVVVPGDAKASSLVVNAARIGDPEDAMPPAHNKAGIPPLKTEQVSLLRAWVEQGAK